MRGEIAGGFVLFLGGGVTVALSLGMPLGNLRMPGPGMFPMAMGALLMILSGIWTLRFIWQHEAARKSLSWRTSLKRVLPFVGAMALCVLLLDALGYPLTSFVLLLVLFRLTGSKAWALNFFLAWAVAGVSYLVFVRWLQVPLPRGLLGL
ncbi:MAG: tripartite tricarboxylate transporter TctB family protein [bacterium]